LNLKLSIWNYSLISDCKAIGLSKQYASPTIIIHAKNNAKYRNLVSLNEDFLEIRTIDLDDDYYMNSYIHWALHLIVSLM